LGLVANAIPDLDNPERQSLQSQSLTAARAGTAFASEFWRMKCLRRPTSNAFTLIEVMIVVSIIALIAAIAVPGFVRARKRSQAARILNDLRLIDGAIDQYALETSRKAGDPVSVVDWTSHLKKDTLLYRTGQDLFGNDYSSQTVDIPPQVPSNALRSLSDVTEQGFWSPFGP
jgi:prepilin-type N-terminal cleavage/methylation domain-containing protein